MDASCSTLLGMRGGIDSPDEYDQARALGFTVVPWDDLAQLGTGVVAAAVEAIGERKAFITVDADFVDPGFAPAVGTPEVGGPSSAQALALIRGCRGLDLAGADIVEVVPELDSSNLTATVAATIAYELLSLMACSAGACEWCCCGCGRRRAGRRPARRLRPAQYARRRGRQRARRPRVVEAAADQGARLVALPETWAFKGRREGIVATAEPPDGPSNRALAAAAARRGIWLLAGSVYEPAAAGLVSNVSALFDPAGDLRAVYRKIHLFDVTSGAVRYEESEEVEPGEEIVTVDVDTADSAPVRLGLSICYDLRFPGLYTSLALRGARILCVPAAFTAHTGAAHWEVLLRARAIENGCFVVAPDQVGAICRGATASATA